MPAEELVVHGAREHNLKDVTVTLPRNALICITGPSDVSFGMSASRSRLLVHFRPANRMLRIPQAA